MKGYRKFWMTIITGIFALAGLLVIGWLFKNAGTTSIASEMYLIYCLTCVGGLTAFTTGNAIEHVKTNGGTK